MPPSALLVWARRSLQTCAIVDGASVVPLLVKKPPTGSAHAGAPCAGASVMPLLLHEKITRRPVAYCARVEPMPGHDVPLLLPPLAAEYVAECTSMHWPWLYFGTAPLFLAAAAPAGIVSSTFASSADAKRANPVGELPVPFDAGSMPPSISQTAVCVSRSPSMTPATAQAPPC